MTVTGIIAEFNPLHNGHVNLIRHARRHLNSSYVVIIMSGDFTQRGTPAMLNKYERAKLAIRHGADLVIEMPVLGATASAETFAASGVNLLERTGIVDNLLFGAENDDMSLFRTASRSESGNSMDLHHRINDLVKKGIPYAAARQQALDMQDSDVNTLPPSFLLQPNNILGVEYMKALNAINSPITPHCTKRTGNHNSTDISGANASGLAIRQAASSGRLGGTTESIPDDVVKMIRFNSQFKTLVRSADISLMLHTKLISKSDFSMYIDSNDDISNKINNTKDKFVEFENYCNLLKTKDILYTRISRVLIHILLNLTKEDMLNFDVEGHAPYLRILAFSSQGQTLLSKIKSEGSAPMFLSAKEGLNKLSVEQQRLLKKDVYASDIYRAIVTGKSGRIYPTEFTREFSIK